MVNNASIKLLFAISLICAGIVFMSVLNTGKVYIFSAAVIKITCDGKAVKNAKVVRRWEWKDNIEEDYLHTDGNGMVEFDAVSRISIRQFLPVQFFVAQQLVVVVDDREELIWETAKMSPSENSELGGNPLALSCDISSKEKIHQLGGAELYTKCTWSDNNS